MNTIENQISYAKSREGAEAPSRRGSPSHASQGDGWPRRASECPASKPKIIPKAWGEEQVFASTPDYCGKILRFNRAGAKMSMHLHRFKAESWLCYSGSFIIRWIDPRTAKQHEESFNPGDTWTNDPCEPHQIECLMPGDIFEVSTHDDPDDNIRVQPGDSQKEEVDIVTTEAPDWNSLKAAWQNALPDGKPTSTSYICGDCGQPHEDPNECPTCGGRRVIQRAAP